MEEKKLNELQLKKDINLSDETTVEDAIEAIKESKAYIIAYVHQENGVGLIKNVRDNETLDFVMSLLGGAATLGFIAKYLRSENSVLCSELADECTTLADDLYYLFLRIHNLPPLDKVDNDDESDE